MKLDRRAPYQAIQCHVPKGSQAAVWDFELPDFPPHNIDIFMLITDMSFKHTFGLQLFLSRFVFSIYRHPTFQIVEY